MPQPQDWLMPLAAMTVTHTHGDACGFAVVAHARRVDVSLHCQSRGSCPEERLPATHAPLSPEFRPRLQCTCLPASQIPPPKRPCPKQQHRVSACMMYPDDAADARPAGCGSAGTDRVNVAFST
ncbi:hypothetical protein B0H17DRAFT_1140430 [Mycena rosella]|uniref:Uncharacterized protein n=1 Tax=Mycena rosella TaxID=1033263 RepID=A0AAD7D219_MYCRO|nr:hypothetical protein B0H17DRAFT_1140430 [Mycena rosella]